MKIVSACNFGYLPLTLNWLKSLELLGLQENVLLYSLDKKVQEALNEKGIENILWETTKFSDIPEEHNSIHSDAWADIVFRKIELVNATLKSGEDVFFTDSDIIFKKNPIEHLKGMTENLDMVIQCEGHPTRNPLACSGVYYAKSCESTISLTNVDMEYMEYVANRLVGLRRTPFKFDCDQGYLNARLGLKPRTWKFNKMFADEEVRLDVMSKPHTKFDFLSRDEFPTGDYWLDNQERVKDRCYLIHYNSHRLQGPMENKINQMKKDGNWLI